MNAICRLLIVEDNIFRVDAFQQWCPVSVRIVWVKSAGVASGILQRDRGTVYSGILLDYDLLEQTIPATDNYLCGQQVVQAIIANISNSVTILVTL